MIKHYYQKKSLTQKDSNKMNGMQLCIVTCIDLLILGLESPLYITTITHYHNHQTKGGQYKIRIKQ